MIDFQPIFDWVISWEGKVLELVPGDRGGLTFWGISRNANPNWSGWVLVDQYMKAAGGDIHQASFLANQDDALLALTQKFYQNSFISGNFDKFSFQELALQAFDKYWNMGTKAVRALQILVLVQPDGVIGPKTIEAVNEHLDQSLLVDQYLQAISSIYNEIVVNNPEDQKFLDGWLNRCHRSDQSGPSH